MKGRPITETTTKTNSADSSPGSRGRRPLAWWPLLLGPGAMLLVYLAYKADFPQFYAKRLHENLAMVLLPLALVSFAACSVRYRQKPVILLAVLTAALFCREWHFPGTSKGIYIALVLLGFWAYRWRDTFRPAWRDTALRIWILAVLATYFLSQFIARRAFRDLHLPMEKALHVPWEEVVETTAHLMLIVGSLLAWRYCRGRGSAAVRGASAPPAGRPSPPAGQRQTDARE